MKVILIAAYVISCFLNDRFSFFPLLGSFAAYGLSPMTAGKLVAQKNGETILPEKATHKTSFWLVIIFIIAEFFCSYYLRLCCPDVFKLGRIEIGGIELINSFIVPIELLCAIIYFVIYKVRLFAINRKIVLYIVLIIVPFVIRDFFSASQTILETGKHYNLNKYINMTYKSLVLAAFTEEVVYRGMIFSELRTHFKLMPSAIIQSTIFTLVHSEMIVQIFRNFDLYAIIHILAVFAMGILAAGMTHRTKSLWPSIIMHFALDGGIWYIMLPVMQKNI